MTNPIDEADLLRLAANQSPGILSEIQSRVERRVIIGLSINGLQPGQMWQLPHDYTDPLQLLSFVNLIATSLREFKKHMCPHCSETLEMCQTRNLAEQLASEGSEKGE